MASEQLIPIEIVNPSSGYKIPEILHKFRQRPQEFNLEEISKRLKDIRNYTVDHLDSLLQQLEETLKRYPRVDTIYAGDIKEAVVALKRICASSKKIYVNNSNTVEELREHLIEQGFEIEETYYQEFEGFAPVKERKPYWQIPEVVSEVKWRSFSSIPVDWGGIETRFEGLKDKVVLFGVNAIAAEDGTVFFLEHSRNITRGLHEASRVVLLAGLEKIVENREDALFQTFCMGLFGLEGISSELKLQSSMREAVIENQQRDMNPQITIILLDNGRRAVRKNFKELLSCIGCRTCNAVCPVFTAYESRFEGPRNWLKIFNEVFENVDGTGR